MADAEFHVDLTNCDREPIHLLGAIQPVGFLIAVSTDWIIARVSANLGEFLPFDAQAAIGTPLTQLLPPKLVHDLRNRVAYLISPDTVERMFGCQISENGPPFDIAIHNSGGQIIIEAEPGAHSNGDASGAVRSMMTRLDNQPDLPAFYKEGARQIRALLGYDRVMVYKFAPDGAGEVVAEACKSGIGSFRGVLESGHYPCWRSTSRQKGLQPRFPISSSNERGTSRWYRTTRPRAVPLWNSSIGRYRKGGRRSPTGSSSRPQRSPLFAHQRSRRSPLT